MKEKLRYKLIDALWQSYEHNIPFHNQIFDKNKMHLDHLAIIDLPSKNSGIRYLSELLNNLGFIVNGSDYLVEKQNTFQWLVEEDFNNKVASETIPQIIIADFKLDELSIKLQNIVNKYAAFAQPIDQVKLEHYLSLINQGNEEQLDEMIKFLHNHIINKYWPSITLEEYNIAFQENELIAWVLAHGRVVNHFGISIHLSNQYSNLIELNNFIINNNIVKLNTIPQLIKGGEHVGIAQASTEGLPSEIQIKDSKITTYSSFLEFVWRYPVHNNAQMSNDFYQGFIPQNANHVVESIYASSK